MPNQITVVRMESVLTDLMTVIKEYANAKENILDQRVMKVCAVNLPIGTIALYREMSFISEMSL